MSSVLAAMRAVHDAIGFQHLPAFDVYDDTLLVNHTYWLPITAIAIYVASLIILPKLFRKDHPGFRQQLRYPAALWNLVLALGSMAIFLGMGVPYLTRVEERGFFETVYDTAHDIARPHRMWIWCYVFVLSKYMELGDTLFLILKAPGRDIIRNKFLHWYHHVTVLAFTWFACYNNYTGGYMFLLFNAFVHSLMYSYYFLTELGIRPGNLVAMPLTVLQISQMVFGIYINGYWARCWFLGYEASTTQPEVMLIAALVMYASYLYLFCQFFVNRYIGGAKKPTRKTPAKKKTKKDN